MKFIKKFESLRLLLREEISERMDSNDDLKKALVTNGIFKGADRVALEKYQVLLARVLGVIDGS